MDAVPVIDEELADVPPPGLEEEKTDILAFEVWHHGTYSELAPAEKWLGEEAA